MKPKLLLLVILALALFNDVPAQDSSRAVRVVVKPAYLPGMLPARKTYRSNDSLVNENNALKSLNDSLLMLLNNQMSENARLTDSLERSNKRVENLRNKLTDVKDDQLQTSHTSSVLMIFLGIGCTILLVTLFWLYARKKSPEEEEESVQPRVTSNGNPDLMEAKLERIEKLGKLRDKGLLTEEEFQLQKKQILG